MKFLKRSLQPTQTPGRWVFFDRSPEHNSPDVLSRVANLMDGSADQAPLNASISGAINRTRVGVEDRVTSAENNRIVTDRFGDYAIARQREANGLLYSSTYNLSAPTERWFFPDKAMVEGLNPFKWWDGVMTSKGPMYNALRESMRQTIDINKDSQLLYNQLSYNFLDNSLSETLDAVNEGKRDNVSLFALDVIERGLDNYLPQARADFDEFESEMRQRNEAEETWKKKFTRRVFFWTNRGPQTVQARIFRRQMEKGVAQLKANIRSAREVQSRKVENIQARMLRAQQMWIEQGDTEKSTAFWRMTTEVLQNPEEFLSSNQATIQGFNWRKEFDVGRGKSGKINLLDTLNSFYLDNALDMPAIQAVHKANERHINDIRDRHAEQEEVYKDVSFNGLRDEVYKIEIERAPKTDIPAGTQGTLMVTDKLIDALQSHPVNINVETEVFQRKVGSINRSPMERFAQVAKYILANKELLNSKNPSKSMNVEALAYLKGYLRDKEEDITTRLESRSISEGDTPFARAKLLKQAEGIVDSAMNLVTQTIPNLAEQLVNPAKKAEVNQILQDLQSLPANIAALKQILGLTNEKGETNLETKDKKALINQVTQTEKETFLDIIINLDPLAQTLSQKTDQIRKARAEYAKLLAVPDEPYINEKVETVKAGEKTAAGVVESTGGALNIQGEGRIVGGFAGGGAGVDSNGGAEGDGGGGSGMSLETSLTTFMRYIQDVYNDINGWKSMIQEREGFTFPMVDNLEAFAKPMLDSLKINIKQRQEEIGVDKVLTENPHRMSLEEGMRLEMALEANASMRNFSERILQNYQSQQWQRMASLPVGAVFSPVEYSETTNQTKTNTLNAVLNPSAPLTKMEIIPTPRDEPNAAGVIYAAAEDADGNKWWAKLVSPQLTSGQDASNIFLYKREGDLEQFNPHQLAAPRKGLVLTMGIENTTLKNNEYYAPLWKTEGETK